jgi:uncharacterized protein YndB with AHSA1/START domain
MNKPEFVYVSYIATTPEKLWKALISPEFTRQYWAGRTIQSDWKVGSPVKLLKADGGLDWRGEILQSDPPRLLSYTFDPQNFLQSEGISEPPSRVAFEISGLGPEKTSKRGVVRLQVTHDSFQPDSEVARAVSQGWPAILSSLKSLLESERSLEFDWKC